MPMRSGDRVAVVEAGLTLYTFLEERAYLRHPTMPLAITTRYLVGRRVGQGSFSTVYQALWQAPAEQRHRGGVTITPHRHQRLALLSPRGPVMKQRRAQVRQHGTISQRCVARGSTALRRGLLRECAHHCNRHI